VIAHRDSLGADKGRSSSGRLLLFGHIVSLKDRATNDLRVRHDRY
jgi:hypothetical protein